MRIFSYTGPSGDRCLTLQTGNFYFGTSGYYSSGTDSVDSHGAYSGDLGGFEGSEKRIPYQCPAEPSSLVGTGHGKTGKDHDRDRSHFRRAIMSSDGEAGAVETKTVEVAGYVCLKNGDGAVKPVFFSYPVADSGKYDHSSSLKSWNCKGCCSKFN